MLDSLKPGQTIRCTLTTPPHTAAGIDTIERFMRQEPAIKRGLRKAQRQRRQGMIVYNRGNRDWYKRELCAKIVKATKGATWTMQYSHQILPDLRSLAKYIQVVPA